MVAPLIAAAGALASKVGPWVLTLAPMIAEVFSGSGNDAAAMEKVKQARDGMAARLAEGEGIPLSEAMKIVDEQLKPLVDQHEQEAQSKAGSVVNAVATGAGAFMLGKQALAKKAAGALKGAVGAADDVALAGGKAAHAAESMVPAGPQSPLQAQKLQGLVEKERFDRSVIDARKNGELMSGRGDRVAGDLAAVNRLEREATQARGAGELMSGRGDRVGGDLASVNRLEREATQARGAGELMSGRGDAVGQRLAGENRLARMSQGNDLGIDVMPSQGQADTLSNAGTSALLGNVEEDGMMNDFKVQQAIRRLLEMNGFKGFRRPGMMGDA